MRSGGSRSSRASSQSRRRRSRVTPATFGTALSAAARAALGLGARCSGAARSGALAGRQGAAPSQLAAAPSLPPRRRARCARGCTPLPSAASARIRVYTAPLAHSPYAKVVGGWRPCCAHLACNLRAGAAVQLRLAQLSTRLRRPRRLSRRAAHEPRKGAVPLDPQQLRGTFPAENAPRPALFRQVRGARRT